MGDTSTNVVDRTKYKDKWDMWLAKARLHGCSSFVVMRSSGRGEYCFFLLCKGDSEASIRQDYEGKCFEFVETYTLTPEEQKG